MSQTTISPYFLTCVYFWFLEVGDPAEVFHLTGNIWVIDQWSWLCTIELNLQQYDTALVRCGSVYGQFQMALSHGDGYALLRPHHSMMIVMMLSFYSWLLCDRVMLAHFVTSLLHSAPRLSAGCGRRGDVTALFVHCVTWTLRYSLHYSSTIAAFLHNHSLCLWKWFSLLFGSN